MKETPYQPIDIVPFDPHHATAAQWAAYHAYRRIRAEEDIPGEPILSEQEKIRIDIVMRDNLP